MNPFIRITFSLGLSLSALGLYAQDLDPRAYVRVPINTTLLVTGLSYSSGGVVTDPLIPLTDLKAKVFTPSFGVIRSFGVLKRTATVLVVAPYSWADASALVNGQRQTASRTGLSDLRVRMTLLLKGGRATPMKEFRNTNLRQTVLGVSLMTVIPAGQYFPDKLINLGTNRWAFKPEFAVSQPLGKKLLLDIYTAVWLFTNNTSFYPGTATRAQAPLGAFQAHISYNVNLRTWIALNTTFYTGGTSTVNGQENADRQENTRFGLTMVLPAGKRGSLKFAVSKGATIRIGADFTAFSAGWQIAL